MNVWQDGLLAFFSAVGMTAVVWIVAAAVFHAGRPEIPGLLLILPLRDEARAMEHDVREVRRIQSRLPGSRFLLADCGMTADAREIAEYLAARGEGAEVIDAKEFRL
ncbi:MAG: hypothetical protein IKN53_00450 [Oscillibacter sp.]|nr:hypothetical protein [Oscillibacter sp.]